MNREISFMGMNGWNELVIRVVEPSGAGLKLDLHNDCYIESIRFNKPSELIFTFCGYPYKELGRLSKIEWRFELLFHNASLKHTKPKGFLPYIGHHQMDEFLYETDGSSGIAHIRWFGDTESAAPDPEIEFSTDTIEFRKLDQGLPKSGQNSALR